MPTQKLAAAFTQHAGKLVDIGEVTAAAETLYATQLSGPECAAVHDHANDPEYMAELIDAVREIAGDGNVYSGENGRLFMTVASYADLTKSVSANLPEKLGQKTDDITAAVLTSATDYSSQKQTLGMKPLM